LHDEVHASVEAEKMKIFGFVAKINFFVAKINFECRSILAIDTSIGPRSTLDRHLGRPSIDKRSTSRSTDFQFSLTLYGVAIDTSDDHTLDVGQRVDRYLTVGCR